MPSDFLVDSDAPSVILFEDGTEAVLPILTNDDLKVIGEKIRALRIEAFKVSISDLKIPASEAVYILGKERAALTDARTIYSYINTVEGVNDVIDLAAKNGNLSADVVKKIKAFSFVHRSEIAIETSGIAERERIFVRKTDEKKVTTPQSGSDTNTAGQATPSTAIG